VANLIFPPIADQIEAGSYFLYDCACGTGGRRDLFKSHPPSEEPSRHPLLCRPAAANLKRMIVTLDLPDDIAQSLSATGDLSRHALEVLAVDAYRQKTLTQAQIGRLLGLARIETEIFLAQHIHLYDYSMPELEAEADRLHRLTGS
jgi:predicted HTH domain antitoxin